MITIVFLPNAKLNSLLHFWFHVHRFRQCILVLPWALKVSEPISIFYYVFSSIFHDVEEVVEKDKFMVGGSFFLMLYVFCHYCWLSVRKDRFVDVRVLLLKKNCICFLLLQCVEAVKNLQFVFLFYFKVSLSWRSNENSFVGLHCFLYPSSYVFYILCYQNAKQRLMDKNRKFHICRFVLFQFSSCREQLCGPLWFCISSHLGTSYCLFRLQISG